MAMPRPLWGFGPAGIVPGLGLATDFGGGIKSLYRFCVLFCGSRALVDP